MNPVIDELKVWRDLDESFGLFNKGFSKRRLISSVKNTLFNHILFALYGVWV